MTWILCTLLGEAIQIRTHPDIYRYLGFVTWRHASKPRVNIFNQRSAIFDASYSQSPQFKNVTYKKTLGSLQLALLDNSRGAASGDKTQKWDPDCRTCQPCCVTGNPPRKGWMIRWDFVAIGHCWQVKVDSPPLLSFSPAFLRNILQPENGGSLKPRPAKTMQCTVRLLRRTWQTHA